MILSVHHVQITIPRGGEEAAREFYCGFLGFREVPKPGPLLKRGGFWMQLGEIGIHVGTEDSIDRHKSKAHLAYQVENLDYWRGRLRQRKIDVIEGVPITGFRRFEFRDPFGNRIEFLEANK